MSSTYLWRSVIETVKCYGLSALLSFGILLILQLFVNHVLVYFVSGTLLLASILANLVKWIPKEKISPEAKAVFITGCDRGFGYMLAQRLDDIGFHVFAGCLFPEGDGAANLRKSGSDRLHVLGLDVTSENSVQEAAAYVKENLKENVLWAVVNNAGIVTFCEVHWISVENIQRTIDVNTLGVVRVTKAFLPKLKESQGRIITVASIAGRVSCPGLGPYSMSKAAVISFSEGLRLEMYKWGIKVITIEPSVYNTRMSNTEEIAENLMQEWKKVPQYEKDIHSSMYIDKFVNKFTGLPEYFARHPSEVVSVMEEAVTSVFPEYSYMPGGIPLRLAFWLSQILPKSICDTALFYILGMDLL